MANATLRAIRDRNPALATEILNAATRGKIDNTGRSAHGEMLFDEEKIVDAAQYLASQNPPPSAA